ncbi:MAG: NUDIX hydrolase [Phycisphaerales bacterium]|nr:MAG: NUDIX hydrolase [Phycisphaerales bacterium]
MRRETLVSGRIFSVERRWYPRNGGGTLMREIVVHPGAVTVLPMLADGSVVMIHNFRHAVEQELLELPAGTLEPGEAPAACAARELEEETGYSAARIEPLCEFFTTPGITNERMLVFVATELTKTRQNLQGDEQIRVEVMHPARLQEMLVGGRIRDGKTIAVLSTFFLRNRA